MPAGAKCSGLFFIAGRKRDETALLPVKIKIAFIAAPSDRALPLEGDAAHIPVDTVIAQAESTCQLFAAQ